MSRNTGLMIVGGLVVIGGSVLLYRELSHPTFYIEHADLLKKEGIFRWGRNTYPFSLDKGMATTGRNGWALITQPKNGQVYFDLHKRGKFVKTLKIV